MQLPQTLLQMLMLLLMSQVGVEHKTQGQDSVTGLQHNKNSAGLTKYLGVKCLFDPKGSVSFVFGEMKDTLRLF